MNLFGIPIHQHSALPSRLPIIKLSPQCPVGDKFRAEFDAWALELFGERTVAFMLDLSALKMAGNRVLMMRPENIVMLQSRLP